MARQRAFQFFYRHLFPNVSATDQEEVTTNRMIQEFSLEDPSFGDLATKSETPEVINFTQRLYQLALHHQAELDALIIPMLKGWRIERLAKVDHTLLLLGATELLYLNPPTPKAVVCNEYTELAKSFGHKESAAFVNGILENIAQAENKIAKK